ncbi:diacylglycerol kinase family protein [Alteromonas sp. CYL-A6]|uniref:diacylglycerol kinase family protein n=1 Tax=Alteromonas nitratireducens TaxID=3390813 RepID=UPI0034B49894
MKMVKYYLTGALIALLCAWLTDLWLLRIILAWAGFSLLTVSLAYLFRYPSLFRKRSNGTIPVYIRWIFVPFLLGTGLYNSWARKYDRVPAVQQITDDVFLACRLFGRDIDTLRENQVSAILDVTAEFDGLDWSAFQNDCHYLNIPVLDHTSPTPEQLHTAINWIDQQIKDGHKVVVHCALGRGRSVLVVAAYLLAKDATLSVDEALGRIQSVRDTARLNHRQLKALKLLRDDGQLALSTRLALIANPVAGGGKWQQHKEDILARLNPHFRVEVLETTPDTGAATLTQRALKSDCDYIIACGGDGTVAEVASQLVDATATLGIIPMGTANALGQVFHGYRSKLMPVSTACDIIIDGHTANIDTARCNDELMLMVAAVGFEEQMISHADRDNKDEGGQMAYLQGLWNAVSANNDLTFTVSFDDDDQQQLTTPSLVIANAAPRTTALAQGSSDPSAVDGKVDITWLTPHDGADDSLLSLTELVFGTSDGKKASPRIKHKQASKVRLSFTHSRTYALDGEVRESKDILIETRPRSLTLLTRKNSPALNTD